MTVEDEIKESLEKKDLDRFMEIISSPKLYINDLFENGVLYYVLENIEDIPIEFIRVLVEHPSVDINKTNTKTKLTPLLSTDREDIQEILLASIKCNVNKEIQGKSLLLNAVQKGKTGLVKKLIDHPMVNVVDTNRRVPEQIAVLVSMKKPEMFKLFLESDKMNVNGVGFRNLISPLEYAFQNKLYEASLALLEKGADINIFAELIINLGNESLLRYLLKNIDKVKNTNELLTIAIFKTQSDPIYSQLENKLDIIGTLLENKCLLKNETILSVTYGGSLTILNKILSRLDKDIHLESNQVLIEALLFGESIKPLEEFVKTQFAIKVKDEIIPFIPKMKNPISIGLIMGVNEIVVGDKLKDILIAEEYNIFMRLVTLRESGIKRLSDLLHLGNVKFPMLFPPAMALIRTGLTEQVELAKQLILEHGVVIQKASDIQYLVMDYKLLDIIDIILRIPVIKKLNIFGNSLKTKELCMKLLIDLYSSDRIESLQLLIDQMCSKPENYQVLAMALSKLLELVPPEIALAVIKMEEFKTDILFTDYLIEDSEKNLFVKLFSLGTNETRNEVLEMAKSKGKMEFVRVQNLLEFSCMKADMEMVNVLRNFDEAVDIINVNDLIDSNPEFVFTNYAELIQGFQSSKYNFSYVFQNILDEIQYYANEIFENEVLQLTIRHSNYDPNIQIKDNRDIWQTQLHLLLEILSNVQLKQHALDTVSVFDELLKNPKLDINMRTSESDARGEETILDHLMLTYGFKNDTPNEFIEDKKYDPIHPCSILQLILQDPRLNINDHYTFQRYVCEDKIGSLFTHMISRPELNIDESKLLHLLCYLGNTDYLNVLLTLQRFNINLLHDSDTTPLHVCIDQSTDECAKLLIEDPRIDLSILKDGKNYAELAAENDLMNIVELLKRYGVKDSRLERMEQEAAEYDARMAAMGRPKQGRLKEMLDIYDAILKERENPDAALDVSITLFSKSLCPFCLVSLEKEDPRECVYLYGHRCHPDVRNEALMARYLGPEWETTHFEVCCTCGRPGKNHGHYRIVPDGETSSLAAPGLLVNHWRCDQYNGGGGKEEMVTRLVGILSYLKTRVDSEEHIEDNAELSRQLTLEADKALFDDSMKQRAVLIFQNKAWNTNSTIAKYKRFNAPRVAAAATVIVQEVREPIVHLDNRLKPEDEKDSCGLCLEERDDLYRPHESDTSYICGVCLYNTVCQSGYRSVTCGLGCLPRKQIHTEDVQALMDGQLCQLMAPIAAEEAAQAAQEQRNYNARRGEAGRNDDLEDGEIRE